MKVFRKFPNIDPSTSECQSLLGQHFISQSDTDIMPTNPYAPTPRAGLWGI